MEIIGLSMAGSRLTGINVIPAFGFATGMVAILLACAVETLPSAAGQKRCLTDSPDRSRSGPAP